MFGSGFARHRERRYRRRGLGRTEREIVAFLTRQGIEGATVLEIGGGVGEIQLELLRAGAACSINLELVPAYDEPARRLSDAAGLSSRMERRLIDIVVSPEDVPVADVVVLHRVVCCYPDHERLLAAAADHARRVVVFSHPPRNPMSRAASTFENALLRLRGRTFRSWTHPPQEMIDTVARRGFTLAHQHGGLVWHVQGLVREDAVPAPL
ncbi:hypothetical protein GCM10009867_29670 [Pedococcus aerophilus]|uniref:Methyltransferase domain-containing protein n=1 Tax=Pedococcus aerophilus TaxID=436356 RepID=A0ABN3UTT7_9MICO